MQFGLASPIVCLYEKSSAFAVGNNASEACLKAGSATGYYDGADLAGRFQALVVITLWCHNLLWVEVKIFEGSFTMSEHGALPKSETCLPLDQQTG